MMIGAIIGISLLSIYSIIVTVLNYNQDKYVDRLIGDYADLNLDLIKVMMKRDELAKKVEEQKDTIADLSRQINEATVKPSKSEANETAAEPITSKKTTTTKKTTTRKRTTKKKEVK